MKKVYLIPLIKQRPLYAEKLMLTVSGELDVSEDDGGVIGGNQDDARGRNHLWDVDEETESTPHWSPYVWRG